MDDFDPFCGNVQLKQLPFSTNVSNQCYVKTNKNNIVKNAFMSNKTNVGDCVVGGKLCTNSDWLFLAYKVSPACPHNSQH